MADDDSTATLETDAPAFDIEAASDQIGADLFPNTLHEEKATPQESVAKAVADSGAAQDQAKQAAAPVAHAVPDSWKKEYHDYWPKLDPKVQEYWNAREREHAEGFTKIKPELQYAKTIRDVIAPFQPLLQAKGLDAPTVITDLMNQYGQLTQGTVEQRQAALTRMAKHLQIPFPAQTNGTDATQPQADPRIQTIEQQLQEMRDIQTAQQRAALQAAQEKASLEVNAFASDPTHAFFDECYEDIVKLLKAGDSLPDAYEKAVWANPVTREKQKLAYFQTESEKAKERARLDALPKQKARGVNVKSQDTQRPLTDPLGSMDDTLRSTMKAIREKTVH